MPTARANASRFKREKIWYDYVSPVAARLDQMATETIEANGWRIPRYYFTMHQIEKVGIHPRPSYSTTPLATYAYPLTPYFLTALRENTLPFRSSADHFSVLELTQPDRALVIAYNHERAYNSYKLLADDNIVRLNTLIRNDGYTSVVDLGTGSIHPNEPDQAAFLTPRSFRILEMLPTKSVRGRVLNRLLEGRRIVDAHTFIEIQTQNTTPITTAILELSACLLGLWGPAAKIPKVNVNTELKLIEFSTRDPAAYRRFLAAFDVDEYRELPTNFSYARRVPDYVRQFPYVFIDRNSDLRFDLLVRSLPLPSVTKEQYALFAKEMSGNHPFQVAKFRPEEYRFHFRPDNIRIAIDQAVGKTIVRSLNIDRKTTATQVEQFVKLLQPYVIAISDALLAEAQWARPDEIELDVYGYRWSIAGSALRRQIKRRILQNSYDTYEDYYDDYGF